MPDRSKTYDVFIAHSVNDAGLAIQVANACRGNGLSAITHNEALPQTDDSDALWEAVAESWALVAILSADGLTPAMAIELGGAWAWNKPIFGITTDPALSLPLGLPHLKLYTVGRVEDVIRAIKFAKQELSDEDRSLLAKLYGQIGVSVDQLALDPRQLEELVRRFGSRAGKTVPGERLLSELLRMRKQGKLSKGQSASGSKPRKGTA